MSSTMMAMHTAATRKGTKVDRAQDHLPVGIYHIEVGEDGEALDHVGAVGDGAQLIPLEHGADDLGKAQRSDGQIVALEPQHRKSDEPREEGRH